MEISVSEGFPLPPTTSVQRVPDRRPFFFFPFLFSGLKHGEQLPPLTFLLVQKRTVSFFVMRTPVFPLTRVSTGQFPAMDVLFFSFFLSLFYSGIPSRECPPLASPLLAGVTIFPPFLFFPPFISRLCRGIFFPCGRPSKKRAS